MTADNRTANLNLTLPDAANTLDVDVLRLISALNGLDSAVAGKEPAITGKSAGFVKWTGSAWAWDNSTYSLSSHNHSGTYAPVDQTHYLGTTAVAINRGSGALSLAGVSIDGDAGTVGGYGRKVALVDYTTWDAAKVGPVGWWGFASGPSAASYHCGLRMTGSDVTYGAELAIPFDANRVFARRINASAFQAWFELITPYNIASQSVSYAATAGSAPASDVYPWAKSSVKPSYAASEVGAPGTTGSGASGSWGISVTGSSASCTGNAATATTATNLSGGSVTTATGNASVGMAGGSNVQFMGDGTYASVISFHRSTVYGLNMGLDTDNVFRLGGWSNGAGVYRFTVDSSGNFVATGNVTGTSDARLKKDWAALPVNFVDRLAAIQHGTYTRIDTKERQVGVSAQSLRELMPEAVLEDKDGWLSVAYGNAALAACIALAQEVVALKAEIAKMKGQA